ncbi:hypothetical protein BGZ81_009482 [Podila clonocystis]|nr:hypothetical protein BGZ81_009482 [Podila clonocystis]
MASNNTVIRSEDPPLPVAGDKPFIIAIVSILMIITFSMIYVLLKRRQDAKRFARQQAEAEAAETSITMSRAPLAPDPMTQIFFNCSTASLETLGHNPPPAYTTKDQHLEFANEPPPPPFSVDIPTDSASTSSSEMMSSQTNENRAESAPREECASVAVEITPEPSHEVTQTDRHSDD